jgi:hypothetical protein
MQSFYSTRTRGSGEAPNSRVTWLSRECYLISVHLVVVNEREIGHQLTTH